MATKIANIPIDMAIIVKLPVSSTKEDDNTDHMVYEMVGSGGREDASIGKAIVMGSREDDGGHEGTTVN